MQWTPMQAEYCIGKDSAACEKEDELFFGQGGLLFLEDCVYLDGKLSIDVI